MKFKTNRKQLLPTYSQIKFVPRALGRTKCGKDFWKSHIKNQNKERLVSLGKLQDTNSEWMNMERKGNEKNLKAEVSLQGQMRGI